MVFYIIDTLNLISGAVFVIIGLFKTTKILLFYKTIKETANEKIEYGLVRKLLKYNNKHFTLTFNKMFKLQL